MATRYENFWDLKNAEKKSPRPGEDYRLVMISAFHDGDIEDDLDWDDYHQEPDITTGAFTGLATMEEMLDVLEQLATVHPEIINPIYYIDEDGQIAVVGWIEMTPAEINTRNQKEEVKERRRLQAQRRREEKDLKTLEALVKKYPGAGNATIDKELHGP